MISDIWRGHIERWADEWCQIIEVYLFGSWAKGDNHSKSDVDIGVILRQKGRDAEDVWYDHHTEWEEHLQSQLGVDVQLEIANEEVAPSIVWPAVKEHGILLYRRTSK
ncbi:nucleotidyltransferase domain-containing protein [uncultured Hyphomonas sp.]|uniref:nucleotidyltransferase family protein n=1 Tax=uncultured Hyphomonas sp. TaxID=225298 RepID=UPI0030D87A47|tara:strand:- start:924 stop:1247 length:324 start_codon:yes stop_codon:yes gene_type:complete